MLGFLQQPYVFAIVMAIVTAGLVFAYSKITDTKESGKSSKTAFFKTLAAGLVAGMGLTYISSSKSETIATEPFDAAPGLTAPVGI